MQLHNARLCMDCGEVHDAPACPACGSESFAYISRWVPAPERRKQPRTPSAVDAYRELLSPAPPPRSGMARWLRRGAIGAAAIAAVSLAWQRRPGTSSSAGASDGSGQTDGDALEQNDPAK
jgi:predicted  nucleic acid-binding Zn-ribbon protein